MIIFSWEDFNQFFNNIYTVIILLGDANSWNVIWGSNTNNSRGLIIENSLNLNNMYNQRW